MAEIGALMTSDRADLCDLEEEEPNGRFIDELKRLTWIQVSPEKLAKKNSNHFGGGGLMMWYLGSLMRKGAKIVGARLVETDKGGPGCSKVRSRLVVQEFASIADPSGE